MQSFIHEALPGRVIFGMGTLPRIVEELQTLDCRHVLLLSTPSQASAAEQLKALLAGRLAGVFSEVVMHTPVDVSERATALAVSLGADAVVSLGGGSTIGLGKAIALRTGLPQMENVVRDLLDTTMPTEDSLRDTVDLPVLGAIPVDPAAPKEPLLVGRQTWSFRAEAVRHLRTNLQFMNVDRPAQVIVVTSSVPPDTLVGGVPARRIRDLD